MSREMTLSLILLFGTIFTFLEQAPIVAQNVKPQVQLRHRPVLLNLESRSFSENPEAFFPRTTELEDINYSEESIGRFSQNEPDFKLGEDLQVKMGETTSSSADPEFDTFSRNEAQSDKVRVLIQLGDWTN